jgi:2-amino-4-hydroxy-6-hydroxymethyldihydropteridine diphosphokinase
MLLLIPVYLSIFDPRMSKKQIHKVVLLLGSNQGNRSENIDRAIRMIREEAGEILKTSSVYLTQPWGFESTNTFLNQALLMHTLLKPITLLGVVQNIEKELGRNHNINFYTSRTIDIDLIFYDELVIRKPELTVPHPLMQLRRFALVPICEILPDYRHPVEGRTVAAILEDCEDELKVELLESDAL